MVSSIAISIPCMRRPIPCMRGPILRMRGTIPSRDYAIPRGKGTIAIAGYAIAIGIIAEQPEQEEDGEGDGGACQEDQAGVDADVGVGEDELPGELLELLSGEPVLAELLQDLQEGGHGHHREVRHTLAWSSKPWKEWKMGRYQKKKKKK